MHRGLAAACSLIALSAAANGVAPEWVHLLPLGQFTSVDGRGPFTVADPAGIIAASLPAGGAALAIDECHATDFAAPRGEPAPARGWIVELQSRPDGIWGRVEWTEAGRALVADRAYRHMSALANFDQKSGRITRIERASLTNNPAVGNLTAFQKDPDMEAFLQKLRAALGLAADADETVALAAVTSLKSKSADTVALQAALSPIAKAVGLKDDADATAVLAAVSTLTDPTKSPTVVALQAAVTTLNTELAALKSDGKRAKSEAVIDKAIGECRAGVNQANREQLIALHMEKPAEIDAWIGALPALGRSGASIVPPAKGKDGQVALSAEQLTVAKALGLKPEDYRKTLAAEQAANEEIA